MYLILRTDSFAKLFFLLTSTGLLLYIVLAFYTYHTAFINVSRLPKYQRTLEMSNSSKNLEDNNRLKYILMWRTENVTADNDLEGSFPFIDRKCPNTNCYLTSNKNLLHEDYKHFDAVVFNAKELKDWRKIHLPLRRLPKQKYIFYSTAPSTEVTVCNIMADEYFNWTSTFRLDSDIVVPFIEVFDLEGNFVAPRESVSWERDSGQFMKEELKIFSNKTKAMVWVLDKCMDKHTNKKLIYAQKLQEEFARSNLVFDIYGCGFKSCPNDNCELLLFHYYFYFAIEEADDEDYVTHEVVKAYHSLTVPIVRGGASYNKFLPDGSYINIGKGTTDKVIATLEYIIRNPTVYYTFHRWRKHYRIRKANPFIGFCRICEYLNDETKFKTPSIKTNFRRWWYKKPLFERCFPRGAESMSHVQNYMNETRRYEKVVIQ